MLICFMVIPGISFKYTRMHLSFKLPLPIRKDIIGGIRNTRKLKKDLNIRAIKTFNG